MPSSKDKDTRAGYLDDEEGHWAFGVRRRLTPTALASVCGTYDMLYLQDHLELDENRNGPTEEDDFFTLEPKDPSKKILAPEDIVGAFKTGAVSGEVLTLKKTKGVSYICGCSGSWPQAPPILGEDGFLTSEWEMDFDWTEDQRDRHVLRVSTVRDDNGNPFIQVKFFFGYSGCAPDVVNIIGKKCVCNRKGEQLSCARLSRGELWKLGVRVDREEMQLRLEKRKARREREQVVREEKAKASAAKRLEGKVPRAVHDEEDYGVVPDFSDYASPRKRRVKASSSDASIKRRKVSA